MVLIPMANALPVTSDVGVNVARTNTEGGVIAPNWDAVLPSTVRLPPSPLTALLRDKTELS